MQGPAPLLGCSRVKIDINSRLMTLRRLVFPGLTSFSGNRETKFWKKRRANKDLQPSHRHFPFEQ
jgi:hypothetical protein